jgi:hypothetical protein
MIYARSNAMVQLQDFFPHGPSNGDESMYNVNMILPEVNTTTSSPSLPTTEPLEEQLFKLHFQRLKDRFNELKKRLMEDCMKIIDRPALQKECFLDLEKLANLEHELSKTTKMDELTKVESEVDNLEIAISRIEKDIAYLFLI